jgi:hypothetical protein
MWKSVVYKEWLKIRWFTLVFTGLGLLAVGNLFLKVQHDFTFSTAPGYWYQVLFQNHQFFNYGLFKFIPSLGALAIALAQYFPETVNKRIKLTFHLPINENNVLLIMMLTGATCILAAYLVMGLTFTAFCSLYFPSEITEALLISILPWFLCGFAVYFLTALIVLEPVWKYRLFYLLVAATFLPVYLEPAVTGGYAPALPILVLFTVILSISLLFSGYRFRKGEM